MKRLLIVFSYKYPFSPPVEQFLHMEMPFHSNENTDIWFVPYARDCSTEKYDISGIRNVSIRPIKRKSKSREFFSGLFAALRNARGSFSELGVILRCRESRKKPCISSFSRSSVQSYGLYQEIKETISLESLNCYSDIILYSYWLNPMSAAICHFKRYLKKRVNANVYAIARAHGQGDLYLEPDTGTYRPNATLLSKELDMVYSISENGARHLQKQGISNVSISRLGVRIPDIQDIDLPNLSEKKVIVSCSVINSNKRVIDIAKGVALLEMPISWIHFGSGPEEQQVVQWCKENMPAHISWKINGWTDNQNVISYYIENHPDAFVNLSYVEGIPVSIMEAMSCGIPCVATDTGASSEIVQSGRNGYLVPRDFEHDEVTRCIRNCIGDNCAELKKQARKTAETLYSADKNFRRFSFDIWNLKEGDGAK